MASRNPIAARIGPPAFYGVLALLAVVAWPLPDPEVDFEAELIRVANRSACEAGRVSGAAKAAAWAQTPCRRIFDLRMRPDSESGMRLTTEEHMLSVDLINAKIQADLISIERSRAGIYAITGKPGHDPGPPVASVPFLPGSRSDGRILGDANPLFQVRCMIVPDTYGIEDYHLRRLFADLLGERDADGRPFILPAWERRFEECRVGRVRLDDPVLAPLFNLRGISHHEDDVTISC